MDTHFSDDVGSPSNRAVDAETGATTDSIATTTAEHGGDFVPLSESALEPVPFVVRLEAIMSAFAGALDGLLAAATPVPIERAADLRHGLRIDAKLACQIFDVWRASSAVAAAARLPSTRRLERLAEAAHRSGVDQSTVGRFRAACRSIDELIRQNAGERWIFDSIIECLGGSGRLDSGEAIELRRAAMQSAAQLFGSMMDGSATIALLRPSQVNKSRLDVAWIAVRHGVRRLTPRLAVPITGRRFFTGNAVTRDPVFVQPPRPIFPSPAGAPDDSHLVDGFCSPSLPPVRARVTPAAMRIIELVGDDVGEASRADLATASIIEGAAPAHSGFTEDGERSHYSFVDRIRVACKQHMIIVGVDRSCELIQDPIFMLESAQYPEFRDHPAGPGVPSIVLPPTTMQIESGDDLLGFPRSGDLIRGALDRLGWDPATMAFFGVTQQYPAVTAVVRTRLMLPDPGTSD